MDQVDVIKLNPAGQETWRYTGQVLERGAEYLILEAFFDRQDMDLHGLYLARGDRFVETYYANRWYNTFEVHSRENGALRGWYCNICRPAGITAGQVSYVDLALDLVVFPDGRQVVLDEDEFAALNISAEERRQALDSLAALQTQFRQNLSRPL